MTRFPDIPVVTASPGAAIGIGGIESVLNEIAHRLDHLCTRGQPGAIDLRSLPMSPLECERLREFLGTGEVRASIEAQGRTLVQETAFCGVWWVAHHNTDGSVAAELIEVTLTPEILKSHRADAGTSATALREAIAERRTSSIPT